MNQSTYTFTRGSDTLILRCMKKSVSNVYIDTENHTVQKLEITGNPAYMLVPDDKQQSTILVWGNEQYSFQLFGKLSSEEMIKMAKALK